MVGCTHCVGHESIYTRPWQAETNLERVTKWGQTVAQKHVTSTINGFNNIQKDEYGLELVLFERDSWITQIVLCIETLPCQ